MVDARRIPDASVYRLSLYHCYLGEMVKTASGVPSVTSRHIADELGIREETVRRDLSFIGGVGRPGSGYDTGALLAALQDFLGLEEEYPVLKVGTAQMLQALGVVFPAYSYGLKPVAHYSELADDVGLVVDDVEIRHVTEIPHIDRALDVDVALVACSPGWVQTVLDLLHEAGVTGVLLLTPAIKLNKPEGMNVSHVRIPCDIKSLACRCRIPVDR